MADYAPNFTNRGRVLIHSTLGEKNLTLRFSDVIDAGTAFGVTQALANEVKPLFYSQVSWDQFYWCPRGGNDFLYYGDIGVNSPGTAQPMEDEDKDIRWSLVGQSSDAARAILYFNAIALPRPANNRLTASANTVLAAVINFLNESPEIVAIDGNIVKWYPYANWKPNDRDIRTERRTGV